MSWLTIAIIFSVIVLLAIVIFMLITNPSLSRNWSPDQFLMPEVSFGEDGKVTIKNIRNINYRKIGRAHV